ncbi:MAG: Ig-like domain-containing protein [Nitrosomonadales bacterium]|nr:Ig-like domain-containing protein [Nitrosomonadales bacterium]
MTGFSVPFLLAAAIVALMGCSDNAPSSGTTTTPATVPAGIALGTSTNSILTDNSTSATLTATLVDLSNAVMPGVAVSFATTSGNLSASSATTDSNGQAIVVLKSGLADFSNRTATVTATVGGQSASIPILIKGSTLALALTPSNTIQVGAGTLAATATVTDAAGIGKANLTIRFSTGATSTGAATLSATTLTTDATGVTPLLTITPTAAGTVVLTAEWLNSAGVATVTTTQNITVTSASGIAFAITTPSANPTALSTAATQALAVTVPTTIGSGTVTDVRISATSGSWTGTSPVITSTSILQTPAANAVAATYTAPANSGSVSVQVDALDGTGAILSSLSRTFVISAPSTAAAQVFLSASTSTISPSSGSNMSTSTLNVTVRDVNSNTVGGAAVMFGLLGTTGSGESVSPAVVYTDSQGKATTTFSAGTSPTLATIHAQASIVGQVCAGTLPDPVSTETNKLCDTTPLRVSSSAVSVSVGFGTAVEDTANTTQYKLPGSVLVVDSNGSPPAAGTNVTLTAFPARYRNGSIYAVGFWTGSAWQIDCGGPFVATSGGGAVTSFTDNEDINRNGILDDGTLAPVEDTPAGMTASQTAALAIPNNGLISPGAAAGGAVPMTVTTDSNGAATFYLQYPKSSAWFIEEEVTARVIVMGTESTAKINYTLPMSLTDAADDNCTIGHTASY